MYGREVTVRRIDFINNKGIALLDEANKVLCNLSSSEDKLHYSQILLSLALELINLLDKLRKIPAYRLEDIKKT
jgi:hypothetical protein